MLPQTNMKPKLDCSMTIVVEERAHRGSMLVCEKVYPKSNTSLHIQPT